MLRPGLCSVGLCRLLNSSQIATSKNATAPLRSVGSNKCRPGNATVYRAHSTNNGGGNRSAQQQQLSKTNLYLQGLPVHTTHTELSTMCERFGKIAVTKVITDKQSNQCKGYAFVEFESPESAQAACQDLTLQGTQVSFAKVSKMMHLTFEDRLKMKLIMGSPSRMKIIEEAAGSEEIVAMKLYSANLRLDCPDSSVEAVKSAVRELLSSLSSQQITLSYLQESALNLPTDFESFKGGEERVEVALEKRETNAHQYLAVGTQKALSPLQNNIALAISSLHAREIYVPEHVHPSDILPIVLQLKNDFPGSAVYLEPPRRICIMSQSEDSLQDIYDTILRHISDWNVHVTKTVEVKLQQRQYLERILEKRIIKLPQNVIYELEHFTGPNTTSFRLSGYKSLVEMATNQVQEALGDAAMVTLKLPDGLSTEIKRNRKVATFLLNQQDFLEINHHDDNRISFLGPVSRLNSRLLQFYKILEDNCPETGALLTKKLIFAWEQPDLMWNKYNELESYCKEHFAGAELEVLWEVDKETIGQLLVTGDLQSLRQVKEYLEPMIELPLEMEDRKLLGPCIVRVLAHDSICREVKVEETSSGLLLTGDHNSTRMVRELCRGTRANLLSFLPYPKAHLDEGTTLQMRDFAAKRKMLLLIRESEREAGHSGERHTVVEVIVSHEHRPAFLREFRGKVGMKTGLSYEEKLVTVSKDEEKHLKVSKDEEKHVTVSKERPLTSLVGRFSRSVRLPDYIGYLTLNYLASQCSPHREGPPLRRLAAAFPGARFTRNKEDPDCKFDIVGKQSVVEQAELAIRNALDDMGERKILMDCTGKRFLFTKSRLWKGIAGDPDVYVKVVDMPEKYILVFGKLERVEEASLKIAEYLDLLKTVSYQRPKPFAEFGSWGEKFFKSKSTNILAKKQVHRSFTRTGYVTIVGEEKAIEESLSLLEPLHSYQCIKPEVDASLIGYLHNLLTRDYLRHRFPSTMFHLDLQTRSLSTLGPEGQLAALKEFLEETRTRARIKVESINWEDTMIKLRILKLLPLAVGQRSDPETGLIDLVGPAGDLDTATSFLQNTCHEMRVFTLQLGGEQIEVSLLGLLDMVSGRVNGQVKYYIDGETLCFVGEEEDVAEAERCSVKVEDICCSREIAAITQTAYFKRIAEDSLGIQDYRTTETSDIAHLRHIIDNGVGSSVYSCRTADGLRVRGPGDVLPRFQDTLDVFTRDTAISSVSLPSQAAWETVKVKREELTLLYPKVQFTNKKKGSDHHLLIYSTEPAQVAEVARLVEEALTRGHAQLSDQLSTGAPDQQSNEILLSKESETLADECDLLEF